MGKWTPESEFTGVIRLPEHERYVEGKKLQEAIDQAVAQGTK